ncbi:MAG TPA: FUSC family protein, partial [Saprospiraceae bacterium]|nr:FUSC family protein [Saprospiraceae bacterium]
MKYFSINEKAFSYSLRIFLGAVIVWWSLYYLHDSKKVWALISVIVVSDPDFETVRITVFSRSINTISGCLVGLAFIFLFGINIWSLLAAIIISVIISTSFRNYPASWKLAPVTVVIVMTP